MTKNVFKPKGGKAGKKKGPKGRGHRELNRRARDIGRKAGQDLGKRGRLIRGDLIPKDLRRDVLRRLHKSAFEKGEANPIGKSFDDRWRDAMSGQDELVSTSTVREFLKGLFEARSIAGLSKAQLDVVNEITDSISAVRLPTVFSGYSLDREVMQHPANRAEAIFDDPHARASEHARRDVQRKDYVVEAMQRAIDSGGDLGEIAKVACRAAIEFTLNYFTAPITASNVLPFSRRAGSSVDDAELQRQVAGRERMKEIYVELGGVLRPEVAHESAAQAITRSWPGPPQDNVFQVAPPSPRRLPKPAPADPVVMDLGA
jgi:hypothetical protein